MIWSYLFFSTLFFCPFSAAVLTPDKLEHIDSVRSCPSLQAIVLLNYFYTPLMMQPLTLLGKLLLD
ncbi:hypothetical protein SEVIR_J003401v4 [Setaria viridis]|uniref:Uncharacterized protein n=3 Tax=Setaria viridis TaxID=4556 RepID=A0ACC3P1B3_SETVI|nr:hypothetical protein SEVIR_1G145633v2 [Setaria viridis]